MEIKILVKDFEDFDNNQSELIGRKFECQGLIYNISYAEFMDCPLDDCVRKDKLREMRGVKRLTKKILDKELELWKALIEETNYWLNGDIYDVQVETKDGEFIECFLSYGLYGLSKDMEAFMLQNKVA